MDDGLENVGITGNVHIIDGFVAFSLLYEQCMMRGPRGQTVGQASGFGQWPSSDNKSVLVRCSSEERKKVITTVCT